MRDIKKVKLVFESVFSKIRFKFLHVINKGDFYAFFLFFKGAVLALFVFGVVSLFVREDLGNIKSIHASVDQEIKTEKVITTIDAEYAQTFLNAKLAALVGGDDLDEGGAIGGEDSLPPTDQGIAFLGSNISEPKETIPNKERTEIRTYVVKPGDTPSEIASAFGISINTLLWANQLSGNDSSRIYAGDELVILPTDGLMYEVKYGDTISSIASRHSAKIDEILRANDISSAEYVLAGQTLMIPGGVKPTTTVATSTTTSSVPQTNVQITSGYFMHPTKGVGRRTQGFHANNGVDWASSCGTPVYASAAGRVDISINHPYNAWVGGFGNYVRISHPNGTRTLYAHIRPSGVVVSAGQQVVQGQLIGYMGTTGRSTGCHVHFEVHGTRNPF